MNNIQSPVTRRTLAKGAAWAVPAVGLMAAAPAFAASTPIVINSCSSLAANITLQSGSTTPAWTQYLAPNVGDPYPSGSNYGVSMGIWNLNNGASYQTQNGTPITGFYAAPGYCSSASIDCSTYTTNSPTLTKVVTMASGAQYNASVVAYTPYLCSPQVQGAGLSMDFTLNTNDPFDIGFSANPCQVFSSYPGQVLKSISLPYSVVPLNGTTPVSLSGSGSAAPCCLYFNITFKTTGCVLSMAPLSYGFSATSL